MSFREKIAVITGGSSGIGFETVKLLSENGATVYNLDIHDNKNPNSHFIDCDVSDYLDVKNATKEVLAIDSYIDILFANAGVHKFATIEETSIEEYQRVMSINCGGVFYVL